MACHARAVRPRRAQSSAGTLRNRAARHESRTLARRLLEAMTDLQSRTWVGRLITTVASYYMLYGSWLLLTRNSVAGF